MNEPSPILRDTRGREYMRWPREGESMGAYREYIKRLLVDYGEVVPVPDEQAIERAAKTLCEIDGAEWDDCDFKDTHRDDVKAVLAAALEQPE